MRGDFNRIFLPAHALLVRPDRYIFEHADQREDSFGPYADALLDAVAATLHLSSRDEG